jgi:hypothetical protein
LAETDDDAWFEEALAALEGELLLDELLLDELQPAAASPMNAIPRSAVNRARCDDRKDVSIPRR